MTKKIYFLLLLVLAGMAGVNAQIRISGSEAPNRSAVLDLNPDDRTSEGNATKGLAMPRVRLKNTTNPYPLLSHVKGMTVYNISAEGDVTPGTYTSDGSRWIRQADSESLENLATNIYSTVFGDTIINYITGRMDDTALMDSVISRITNNNEYIEQLVGSISSNIYNTVLGDTIINYITQHTGTTELGDSIAYYISQHFETTQLGDTIMQYITQNLDRSALMDSVANYISNSNEYLEELINSISSNIYNTELGDTIINYITQHTGTTELGDSIAHYISQHFETTQLGDTIVNYITQQIATSELGDRILEYITQNVYHTALGDSIINLVYENERDGIVGNEVTGATPNGGLSRSGAGTSASPYTLGIASGGVTNTLLANSAVSTEKIGDNAVTSAKIADGAITNSDINASAAIALNKIALPDASDNNGKVLKSNGTAWVAGDDNNTDDNTTYSAGNGLTLEGTTFGIGSGQVSGTMIAGGAVTTAQLGDKSVTAAKINATGAASSTSFLRGDGAWAAPAGDGQGVTSVSGANGITVSNGTTTPAISLPAGTTNGNVLKWNGTAWASAADAGITGEQDGIIGNEVTNATNDGGLTRSGTGTTASPYTLGIASGGVANTHLSNNAVSVEKMGDNAVTSAKIADGTIANADISATAGISGTKLADKSVTVAKVNASGTASSTSFLRGDGAWAAPAGDGQGVTSVSGANGITVSNGTTTPAISLPAGTASGNVLKWNGTAWASAADAGITTEQDGIVGNEVTGATSNGGLNRSGAGSAASPYTLGIASSGVTNNHLANSAVSAEKIGDNAVTSAKIADGTVTNADINASAAIALNKIALPNTASNNGKVLKSNGTAWVAGDDNNTDSNTTYTAGNGLTLEGTTFGIGSGQVSGTMIAGGAVATVQLADKSVTAAKINASGTASSTSFLRGDGTWSPPAGDGQGVTSVSGANGITVTNGTTTPAISLPAGTTNGNVLKWNGTAWASAADAGITTEQDGIVGNEVTNATNDGGLTRSGAGTSASPYTLGITSGGVTNTHLANGAVSAEKIGGNAVTSAKIADGTITNADINTSAAIALNKIALPDASANNGKVLKSNGTGWVAGDDNNTGASYTAGDGLTLDGTAFSIGTGQINGAMIAGSAVANTRLAANAVTTEKIANGTIKAEDLNSMGATNGQVLTYNGSNWVPQAPAGPKFLGMLSKTISVTNGTGESDVAWSGNEYNAIGMTDTNFSKRYFGLVTCIAPIYGTHSFSIYHRELGDGTVYFYPRVEIHWGTSTSNFQATIHVLVYEY